MRDGNVLAHEPPSHLLRRSGTDDLESAFLKLVNTSAPESDTTTREGAATAPDGMKDRAQSSGGAHHLTCGVCMLASPTPEPNNRR
jgi:hypothetical protein